MPSLQLTNAAVGYLGDGRFYASVRGDLHVLLVDQAAKSRWRAAENIEFDQKLVTGYGLPFEIVAQFFANQVKVLGVVNMGSQGRALVAKDGSQRWVKAGDRIGEATVSKVTSKGDCFKFGWCTFRLDDRGEGRMKVRRGMLAVALIFMLLAASLSAAAAEMVNMEFKQAPLVDVFQILGQLGGLQCLG